jgi:uncharacterized protein YkwD
VGETASISTVFTPANTTDKALKYVSLNKSIAAVDENGVITGVGPGTTRVVAELASDPNSIASSVTITIEEGTVEENRPFVMSDEYIQRFNTELVRLINEERAAEGVATEVIYSTAMQPAATIRGNEQLTVYGHTRPDGSSFATAFTGIVPAGKLYECAASTYAANYDMNTNTPEYYAKDALATWMNSPKHKAIIMHEGSAIEAAGGVAYDGSKYVYFCLDLYIER